MSPVQFYELPQDQPSTTTIEPGTGYCTFFDVQSMNFARSLGIGSNPGPSQVTVYIQMVSAEIDAVLINKGYAVPVNSASFPVAGALLNGIAAKGAIALVEEASPNSLNVDRAKKAYDESLKMLSDTKFVLDIPVDKARAEPRGPWFTFQPTGNIYDPTLSKFGNGVTPNDGFSNPADPYFSRQMQF